METHEVAHQADVDQIHRMIEAFAQCEDLSVFVIIKVAEHMGAPAREKYLSCTAGVFAIERLVQQRAKIDPRISAHRLSRPARNRIARRLRFLSKRCRIKAVEFVV